MAQVLSNNTIFVVWTRKTLKIGGRFRYSHTNWIIRHFRTAQNILAFSQYSLILSNSLIVRTIGYTLWKTEDNCLSAKWQSWVMPQPTRAVPRLKSLQMSRAFRELFLVVLTKTEKFCGIFFKNGSFSGASDKYVEILCYFGSFFNVLVLFGSFFGRFWPILK